MSIRLSFFFFLSLSLTRIIMCWEMSTGDIGVKWVGRFTFEISLILGEAESAEES